MSGFFRNLGRKDACCTDCGPATPCVPCCPTTLPDFVYDSITASKTKQAVVIQCPEFVVGGKPIYYRSVSGSGGITTTTINAADCGCSEEVGGGFQATRYEYTGTRKVDLDGSIISHIQLRTGVGGGGEDPVLKCSVTLFDDWIDDVDFAEAWCGAAACGPTSTIGSSYDSASYTRFGCGCREIFGRKWDGTITFTPGDEFTDDDLYDHVVASMPAYDDDRDDPAGSYRHESTDGSELDLRFSKGFLPLATVEGLVDGRNYDLIYIVRWTPESGPSVDGDEQTFGFTYTTGQTHAGPVDVPEATENGTYTLHQVHWECPSP
ncbi:MAG TPA: hypothetical protein VK985_09615 [Rariglobus sp.]|nr:hypothetical protein [Rariglobus sp.]